MYSDTGPVKLRYARFISIQLKVSQNTYITPIPPFKNICNLRSDSVSKFIIRLDIRYDINSSVAKASPYFHIIRNTKCLTTIPLLSVTNIHIVTCFKGLIFNTHIKEMQ
jgi:hypothetical protein